MTRTARWTLVWLALGCAARAYGGAFLLSESYDVNAVSHPTGYTGTGGVLTVTVCIDPSSPNAGAMVYSIQNAIATWNGLTPTSPNLLFGGANNVPSTDVDFESAALHEMGHCIGLNHPNLSTESGLSDPQRNYTKTTTGANTTYDLDDGADNVIGSSDDVRGDDVNVHWFRVSNNNPYTIASTVDATTYSRNVASLPGGDLFVANADRDVGALLGFPDTEAVMQQCQFQDEAQRTLNHDDVATFRLGMSGIDMTAGTSDDYTINLVYGGMATGCDINVKFDDSQTGFAVCQTSLTSITATHFTITAANMFFNTGFSWFFNAPVPSTTTTTTSGPTTTTTGTLPDDTGFIPPDASTFKCEDTLAKVFAKYVQTVIKCHRKAAKAGAKGIPLDDELCESDPSTGKGAEQRYTAATAKLVAKGCGGCAIANAPGLRVDAESFLEANNAQIYCAGSTPFPGGDDTGFVPPDASTARCEDAVAKALSKYMAGVVKCHRSAIKSGFKGGSHDDEACESGKAGAKYDAVIAKFATFGCGGCGIANAPGLRTSAEAFLDMKNGQVYCAGSTPF